MKQGRRFGFSEEQKLDVCRRWKAGQTLHEIGRAPDEYEVRVVNLFQKASHAY